MINILLCEQNSKWLKDFPSKLKPNMKLVDSVENGKAVQKVLSENEIDALIINLETKDFSFFEILKFVKQRFPKTLIYLLVNEDTKLKEFFYTDKEITKLGVAEIYEKPFPVVSLIHHIAQSFTHKAWMDVVTNADEVKDDSLNQEQSIADRKFTSLTIDNPNLRLYFQFSDRMSYINYINELI